MAGYAEGAKLILSSSRKGKLSGALGTISNFIDVPEEYEKAIASALGETLDAVITDDDRTTDQALEILLNGTTKGVLLPLNRLVIPDRPKADNNLPSLIGIAADLVTIPPRYKPVIELLGPCVPVGLKNND